MPGVVIVVAVLSTVLIATMLMSVKLMLGSAVFVIMLISVIVYFRTNNYGESALSLIVGLLTVFSIEWTSGLFIVYAAVWTGFSLLVFIILSIRTAAESEEIYRQASIKIASDASEVTDVEKKLQKAGQRTDYGVLGPIERAKAIRILSFRNLPIDVMPYALAGIEKLSVITQVDLKNVAVFVAIIYKIFDPTSDFSYKQVLDRIYEQISESPVSPEEFVRGFDKSLRIVLTDDIEINDYLEQLKNGFESGVSPYHTLK